VTLVTGLAPGSITDVIARYLGSKLNQLSGQTFLVVNKVGANGIIAATEVARSKPDGYTLMWATSSAYVSNHLMYKNMTYDPLKDLVIISTVTQYGFILLVNVDTPVSSVAELTAYLRKKGGGVYGANNTNMLAAIEMYKASAGLGETQQVRYKSAEQSVRELSNNQVDFVIVDAAYALASAKQGRVKPLAVTQARRSLLAPEIPTMDEAGVKGYEVNGWMALSAPAGTPPDVVDKLRGWMAEVMAMPETSKFLVDLGYEPFTVKPQDLDAFRDSQVALWKKLVEVARIDLQ
jgi:tripartite-type tricarboxylate transporter receptor subunit TctC